MNIKKNLFLLFTIIIVVFGHAQNPQLGWSFSYPNDKFTDDALLDLRYLNEKKAGDNGFIRLSEDGNSFVNETGEAVRFWSINGGSLVKNISGAETKKYARFLAKMGVNMIRFHGSINPKGKDSKITDVDETEVDAIWKMVASMKEEGIYSTISPFWAHNGHMGGNVPETWGIEGYSGKDDLWAVMYFNDTLKQGYKSWMKHLYTEINPYTGIALKDDPAVGLIQVKNEDGLFFWTIQNVKPALHKSIRQKYYKWLINKYESIDKAKAAWGGTALAGDKPGIGEMDIYIVWYATQNQAGAVDKRLSDQVQFMAETQRNFYQEMVDFYRDLGCKQLINGSNWKTADAARLLDAERWTNEACEVIALNRYYDPGHVGENAGWRIDPGHYYEGKSALFYPNKLPINAKQSEGHPVVVTESGWNLPNKYQAEGPFLISAYMSLTGIDGFYWFNPSSSTYDSNPYYTWTTLQGNQHPLSRWTMSIPGQMAMFPANALLYRLAYVSEGGLSVFEERTLESMWKRKIPVLTEEMGFDPNRDTHNPSVEQTEISPLAYLTGRVAVKYDAPANGKIQSPELGELMDFQGKMVTSSGKELQWDYKQGLCLMNAPSAQGICGFAPQNEKLELSDVIIETSNDYVVVNVVSMDEKRISESSKILVQVGTVYRPKGWLETPADFEKNGQTVSGYRIDNTGKMPWKAADTKVKIAVKNQRINQAIVLDAAGYPKSNLVVQKNVNGFEIELPEDAMYVVLSQTTSAEDKSLKSNRMKVFPNPSNGRLSIELSGKEDEPCEIVFRNVWGEKIWEQNNLKQKTYSFEIPNYSGLLLVSLNRKGVTIETDKIQIK